MSNDKAIKYGKEKREPYRGSKAIDASCRNHGSCPWCQSNRKYKERRLEAVNEFAELSKEKGGCE